MREDLKRSGRAPHRRRNRCVAVGVVRDSQLLLTVCEEADLAVAVGELGACLQAPRVQAKRGWNQSTRRDTLLAAKCIRDLGRGVAINRTEGLQFTEKGSAGMRCFCRWRGETYLCAVLGGVQVDLESAVGKGAVLAQVTELLVGVVWAGLSHIPVTQQHFQHVFHC